jgi:nucleoid-associated protein YgaU
MGDSARKVVVGLFLLVVLWIGVYWWWPAEPPITIAPVVREGSELVMAPSVIPPAVQEATRDPGVADSGVVEPKFRAHVVAAGETLETISTRYYGTVQHAGAIARANPLMSPTRLIAGREIRVPVDPENVQGVVVGVGEGASAADGVSEYVVQKGDSLARIAKRLYQDESLSDMIYQANRDRLRSPQQIREGQTLRIPPKPVEKK